MAELTQTGVFEDQTIQDRSQSDGQCCPPGEKSSCESGEKSSCELNDRRSDRELVAGIHEVNEARAAFCRFLASIYLYELTEDQIESLAHMRVSDDMGNPQIAHGYAMIIEYLRHRSHATAQILRVDYAHTFLGAGIYDRVLAPPYESVFTSEERLLMQDARDKALSYYRSEMLDLPEDNTTPEDHLGFELQFVAHLIDRSTEALEAGDVERFVELILKQRGFLTYHQENWLPDFCDAIDEFCQTDFYHGVAELTRGYLVSERSMLDDIAVEFNIGEDADELCPSWLKTAEEEAL